MTRRAVIGMLTLASLVGVSAILHRTVHAARHSVTQEFRPTTASLSQIAPQLAPFSFVRDIPIDPRVVSVARVDDYVYQEFKDTSARSYIAMYIGYWGRLNVGAGHGPDVCLPALGWRALGNPMSRIIRFTGATGDSKHAHIGLTRFEREAATGLQRQIVGFVAIVDGEFRPSSRGVFLHRPPKDESRRFLAHVEVASVVIGNEWSESQERIIRFLEAALPVIDRCL